jgi:hypothetical protein
MSCDRRDGVDYAIAREGEHRLTVVDTETGARAEVRITVKSL